jgi:EAL domain-containing protein (putative c-di-GMP-specific phosphodiesterase class I)
MKVVAEGIEDQGTYDACAAAGCDSAQGFFVGRPMVASAIPAWLGQGHRTITIN